MNRVVGIHDKRGHGYGYGHWQKARSQRIGGSKEGRSRKQETKRVADLMSLSHVRSADAVLSMTRWGLHLGFGDGQWNLVRVERTLWGASSSSSAADKRQWTGRSAYKPLICKTIKVRFPTWRTISALGMMLRPARLTWPFANHDAIPADDSKQ